MATVEITEGWTGDLDFTLTADGVAVDLTGATVELVLTTGSTVVDTSGDVTVVDAANERLDDQRVDAFVAMVAGKLIQVGNGVVTDARQLDTFSLGCGLEKVSEIHNAKL